LGAISGAALGSMTGSFALTLVGAAALGVAAWRTVPARLGFSPWSLAVLVFFAPVLTMAVAPGADMAMHVALARGLLHGVLSPAWPGVSAALYPRGFSAVVAALAWLGYARAGLVAAGIAYVVFWAGLAAMLEALRAPAPRTLAAVAVIVSRTPQAFFGWGGNPTALALGLALFGAAQEGDAAAIFTAGAAAVHPMGAIAGALAVLLRRSLKPALRAFGGLAAVLALLALFGPAVSPRELSWIRDYGLTRERVTSGVLGDPANVATALAAAVLLYQRRWRPVLRAAAIAAALIAMFFLLPYAGLYPARFAPLLLLAVVPLWGEAAAAQIPMLAPIALLAGGLLGHVKWVQQAAPMATSGDLAAIDCLARTVPPAAVIDGAYGDATQWIPALTGHAVTHPHEHVSLFDETDAALAKLPRATFRFYGEVMRYGDPVARTPGPKRCNGQLEELQ